MYDQNEIELEIASLLGESSHPEMVAEKLLRKYDDQPLSPEQLQSLSQFLLQTGMWESLIQLSIRQLERYKKCSWPHIGEALFLAFEASVSSLDLSISTEALLKGAYENESQSALSKSSIRKANSKLETLYRNRRIHYMAELTSLKNEWTQQYLMFKSQRMIEQEALILEKLKKHYHGDPSLQSLALSHAQDTTQIHEQASSHLTLDQFKSLQKELPNPEELQFLQNLLDQTKNLTERTAINPSDLIMMFLFMDAPKFALQLMQQFSQPPLNHWLRLEVLLLSENHLEALLEIQQLEKQSQNEPDTMFALAYLKARALWGLRRTFEAIELMDQINSLRPDYRSASTLVSEWRLSQL